MKYFRINNIGNPTGRTVYFPVRVTKPSCTSPKYCPYLHGESPTTLLYQRDYLQKKVEDMEILFNLAQNEISNLKNRISQLEDENQKLMADLTQAKTSPFKKLFSKKQPSETTRKKGAPFGHPGTSRKKHASIDEYVTVTLQKCPDCSSLDISLCEHFDTHTQEDIVIVKTIKRCFIHLNYWCPSCKKIVYSFADNELPHSPIGPTAKAVACFLHYQIKVSYDDVENISKSI